MRLTEAWRRALVRMQLLDDAGEHVLALRGCIPLRVWPLQQQRYPMCGMLYDMHRRRYVRVGWYKWTPTVPLFAAPLA